MGGFLLRKVGAAVVVLFLASVLVFLGVRAIPGDPAIALGGIRQLALEAYVSYQADAGAAISLIQEVLRANPRVLRDPAPAVGIARLAESCVVIGAGPWVKLADCAAAGGELNRAILDALRGRSVPLPVPQREIRMLSSGAYVAINPPEERYAGRDAA